MLKVGLTGGIGAGKSEVSRLLVSYGAVLIDADRIAREVVEPGTPGLAAVVEAFGDDILTEEGTLDRPKLGSIVFADPDRLATLNALVHPSSAPGRRNWRAVRVRATSSSTTYPCSPRTASRRCTTWSWSWTRPPRPSSTGSYGSAAWPSPRRGPG